MENVKLTLPGGLSLQVDRMTVAEAKEFDAKAGVPDSTVAVLAESVGILAQTNKILAIRLARAVLGVGLREGKAFMETHFNARVEQEARWKAAQARADAESERIDRERRERLDREEEDREREEAARNGDIPF